MRSPLAPAVLVAALLVGACTESATVSVGTRAGAGTPPSADLPGDGTDHAPGHHGTEIEAFPGFGFVHAVDASEFPTMVLVDDAEYLTGAEARAALEEDFGPDGGDLPTGSYLRNTNPGLAEYPMAGNVVITVTDRDGTERVLTPQQWEERIHAQVRGGDVAFFEPYHLVFHEGTVVEVRAQHLP